MIIISYKISFNITGVTTFSDVCEDDDYSENRTKSDAYHITVDFKAMMDQLNKEKICIENSLVINRSPLSLNIIQNNIC